MKLLDNIMQNQTNIDKLDSIIKEILNSKEIIEKEKIISKSLKKEYENILKITFPLSEQKDKEYFFHKDKWGDINLDKSWNILTEKAIESFSYMIANKVISGETLNHIHNTTFFNNSNNYIQYVLFEYDSFNNSEDLEDQLIWEYLWIKM